MTVADDLARMAAAQQKADEVIARVAEPVDGERLLTVSVSDPATGQRLATGFVNYGELRRKLHLVNQRSEHPLPK